MSEPARDLLVIEGPLVNGGEVVVGIDEVGRGALAGPLTVGAVAIVNMNPSPEGLNDSKLLRAKQREVLVEPLESWCASWSLGSVSALEIDAWGLRLALAVAATRALDGLAVVPTHALIDGSFNLLRAPRDVQFGAEDAPALSYDHLSVTTVIKGDRTCATIAAASVLAKVQRDAFMVALDRHFESYGWAANKGYGAPEHLEAIRRFGTTSYHRRTWQLPEQRAAGAL